MHAKMKRITFILIVVSLLAACGTFEVGFENNPDSETQATTLIETREDPTSEITDQPTAIITATPIPSEEQLIADDVAEYFGLPTDQLEIHVTNISGNYAYGFIENSYFIAVKQDGTWRYVHGGHTNPYCRDVEPYDFPLKMVPECMDENNQVVMRSDGVIPDVGEALEQYFGVTQEELDYTILQEDGRHILGSIPDGNFLAVNVDGGWQIIFDGNGTPSCAQVDLHNFPAFIVPECIDANLLVIRSEGGNEYPELQSLECGPGSPGANPGTPESMACNIQESLRSRNISALLGHMEDPFIIGYWLSEGVYYAPQDFLNHLPQLYNFNDPDYTPRLTFTTDRGQFPELDGRPLEGRYGPDVNVVEVIFSRGWGEEGDQEVLIFIAQDSAGDFKWHGILSGDLDVPAPAPVEY